EIYWSIMNKINDYCKLVLALILAAATSVSMHVLILQHAHAPQVNKINATADLIFWCIIQLSQMIGIILIYIYSQSYCMRLRWIPRILLFAVLLLATSEEFRRFIMNILVGQYWVYTILSVFPTYFEFLILSLVILVGGSYISKQIRWKLMQYSLLVLIAF